MNTNKSIVLTTTCVRELLTLGHGHVSDRIPLAIRKHNLRGKPRSSHLS